ncbi:MAG TPA: peptidase MA family metallohydrolase, partial [Candidatus Limnocylindria bacterium]|nr:peptidase MA family metallohydrolase [Candidatus Limnocylindria bacterium]
EPSGDEASYAWDAAESHVVPNTAIVHSWRARDADGEVEAVSAEATHVYDDDRAGFDWQEAELGDATVHWYGNAEERARRLGDSAAGAARSAEALLGNRLAAPIDIFVYRTRDEFFGALGPGAREWTGAAAFPDLRTVFLYLEGGSDSYLERVVVHEVTHVVFHDATDNPYHEPAHWLNEGIATWSEERGPGQQRPLVELEARSDGLFAFEALTDQFPIGERGSALAYAQGTVMVDRIIDEHGEGAVAAIAAAYRDGATDAEALEAATGAPAEQLYDDFYDAFGADQPEPVTPEAIPPSDVSVPGDAVSSPSSSAAPARAPGPDPDERPAASDGSAAWLPLVPVVVLAGVGLALVLVIRRRAASRDA